MSIDTTRILRTGFIFLLLGAVVFVCSRIVNRLTGLGGSVLAV